MSYIGQSLEIRHVESRVTDTLNVDQLCLFINGLTEVFGIVGLNEMSVDAQLGEQDLELVVGATIDIGAGNNVITSLTKSSNSEELSSLAYYAVLASLFLGVIRRSIL